MEKILLREVMQKRGITTGELARKTRILRWRLYFRLWGMVEFTQGEIVRVSQVLKLSEQEIAQIFFGKKFPKGNK